MSQLFAAFNSSMSNTQPKKINLESKVQIEDKISLITSFTNTIKGLFKLVFSTLILIKNILKYFVKNFPIKSIKGLTKTLKKTYYPKLKWLNKKKNFKMLTYGVYAGLGFMLLITLTFLY